jgi:hypothetical protein
MRSDRGGAEGLAARQGAYGWRLMKRVAFTLIVVVVALVLFSLQVPGAKLVALAAIFAFVGLMYVGPWLGPRRRSTRRRRG